MFCKDKIIKKDDPVTCRYIHDMTSVTDEDIIKAILVTGASKNEIMKAYNYKNEIRHVQPAYKKPLSGRVRYICDLLDFRGGTLD